MFKLRTKKVKVGANLYKIYSIGWLAKMMGITTIHLRKMEREGNLPKPILATENAQRFYLVVVQQVTQRAVALSL